MIWVIIGVIFAIIGFCLGYFCFSIRNRGIGLSFAMTGFFIVSCISLVVINIAELFPSNVQYEIIDEETYSIATFDDGNYINIPQRSESSNSSINTDEMVKDKTFYTTCGAQISDEWSYCGNCGTKLNE